MAKKTPLTTSATTTPTDDTTGAQPTTSMFTVVGWLLLVLAVVPLIMAAHGDGSPYLWTGLGLLVVGGVLLVIGHVRQNFN